MEAPKRTIDPKTFCQLSLKYLKTTIYPINNLHGQLSPKFSMCDSLLAVIEKWKKVAENGKLYGTLLIALWNSLDSFMELS